MNMTPEQESQLRRLLKLKRYELPPPGYFNRFPSQVIARIQLEPSQRTEGRLFDPAAWLHRLLVAFEVKPALAGMVGAIACLLLIAGIVYSEKTEYAASVPLGPLPGETALTQPVTPASIALGQAGAAPMLVSSTNPIAQPAGSLFDQIHLEVQPVDGHTSLLPP